MESATPFSHEQVEVMVTEAISNVFDTMMSLDIKLKESFVSYAGEPPVPRPALVTQNSVVCGSVGFLGETNGVMYIYLDDALAKQLTCAFLGMEPYEVEADGHETVNDALGEITNMSVGAFKNQLCDKGFNCKLTLPSILRGNNFAVEAPTSKPVTRELFYFDCLDSTVVVDLVFKHDD